jgi:enediyne biosynthesis protein E4
MKTGLASWKRGGICLATALMPHLATALMPHLATAETNPPCAIRLTDVTRQTGIDFVHTDGSSGQRYIVETVSAGLATFDCDGDGNIDILFLSGAPLRGTKPEAPPTLRLYRNEGHWKFTDVTRQAGLAVTCYALGVAIGDYDNDGHPDIYLNNFGTNLLLHNNGNGTFTDVTGKAGVADENHVGAGTCFLDMDGDGDLDLFVSHYVDFNYERHHIVRFNGYPAYVGPLDYPTTANRLYRNNGDGTFTDVSVESGIAAHKGAGMGMVCADFDQDGDTDILVGNDETGNFLFVNNGRGRFEECGLISGIAYDFSGRAHGTMGVECGDYDNDGWLDVFATSFQREMPVLFRNLGHHLFEDVTAPTGAAAGTLSRVTWGCGLLDLDNDGDRDLFIAAGHLQDNVELFDTTTTYAQRNQVLMNLGHGRFANVSDRCGDGLAVELSSRGAAFDDLDNDGDLDVVVLNSRREPTLLRNDSLPGNHWLQLQLRGVKTNRDGVGARVTVVAGDRQLVDEVHSGRSYQSHFGSRLHFGLGKCDHVDRVEVRWIGGGTDVIRDVGVDRRLTITEGVGPGPR